MHPSASEEKEPNGRRNHYSTNQVLRLCSSFSPSLENRSLLMTRLNLGKKLQPARKAWKSFKSTLEKKLHKLKRPKSISKTTKRFSHNLTAILQQSRRSLRLGHQLKGRVRARPAYALHTHHQQALVHNKQLKLPVTHKVNDKATPSAPTSQSETKFIVMQTLSETTKDHGNGEVGGISNVHWSPVSAEEPEAVDERAEEFITVYRSSVSAAAQLKGVDKRAEEFIAKFKEQMRLQRQRSFGECQDMLARGVR